jgi:hypothetical protein
MEQKKQVTREHLTLLLAKFIKDCQKGMGDKTNIELPIDIENWNCGMGRNSKWSHTDIIVGSYPNKTTYTFTDREITNEQFVRMLKDAIAKSNVRARVVYDECGDGYWCDKVTIFRRVEVFAKPCREFRMLYDYVEKYGNFTIPEDGVYYVRVCGKRSIYNDSGRYNYLCYDARTCKAILDGIKAKRTSKDKLNVSIKNYLNHGDEMDYRCAMHQESEWYGHRGQMLCVEVTTPKGKVKISEEFYD